jgi:ribosomal protein L14E/L6E/L27E
MYLQQLGRILFIHRGNRAGKQAVPIKNINTDRIKNPTI